MDKAEIALELTKLITPNVIRQERNSNDFPKVLADTYNEIYNTINITENTK